MANNFNLNDNKQTFGGSEYSQTTIRGNFSNDETTFKTDGVPYATPSAITFNVVFNNADNNGGTETYTAQPMETIGHAIEEQALELNNYAPTYYFNESIVTDMCQIKIKSDIEIDVKWTQLS